MLLYPRGYGCACYGHNPYYKRIKGIRRVALAPIIPADKCPTILVDGGRTLIAARRCCAVCVNGECVCENRLESRKSKGWAAEHRY